MKRNADESIKEIRELCIKAIDDTNSHYAKNPLMLLARIEWICRHTEEDYDEPNDSPKI